MSGAHSLEAAVRAYQQRKLRKAQAELDCFKAMTLDEALSHAGLAERYSCQTKRWVRYDHQRRIPRASLEAARECLRTAPLASCASFHALFLTVQATIGHLPRIGELMVYDTSLRIGGHLGLQPDHVYLHSGTRVGARCLGLDWRSKWIERHQLPEALRSLPSWQVEDVFCIFKDWFSGYGHKVARCG